MAQPLQPPMKAVLRPLPPGDGLGDITAQDLVVAGPAVVYVVRRPG